MGYIEKEPGRRSEGLSGALNREEDSRVSLIMGPQEPESHCDLFARVTAGSGGRDDGSQPSVQ